MLYVPLIPSSNRSIHRRSKAYRNSGWKCHCFDCWIIKDYVCHKGTIMSVEFCTSLLCGFGLRFCCCLRVKWRKGDMAETASC